MSELQSIQDWCPDIVGIPRTSLPTLEDRCKVETKCKLERIVNDIKHPIQTFLTKPNTSHGYNLRSKLGLVAIPKSGKQRNINTFKARAPRLLLMICMFYLPLLQTYLIVFHSIYLPLSLCMLFLKMDKQSLLLHCFCCYKWGHPLIVVGQFACLNDT